MIQLYEFTVLRFYRLFLLMLYIDTLRLYAFTILRFYRLLRFTLSAKNYKFTNLRFYGFTVNFTNLPNLSFYAPKAARSDRKFTNLPFYAAFLGNNGIYIPFYGFTVLRRALAKDMPSTRALHTDTTDYRYQAVASLFSWEYPLSGFIGMLHRCIYLTITMLPWKGIGECL